MPLHEYKRPDGSRFERLFWPGEAVPDEIDGAERLPPACSFMFSGPMSGGTPKHLIKTKLGPDQQVIEPGVEREVKERKRLKEKAQDEKRKSVIQETLAGM